MSRYVRLFPFLSIYTAFVFAINFVLNSSFFRSLLFRSQLSYTLFFHLFIYSSTVRDCSLLSFFQKTSTYHTLLYQNGRSTSQGSLGNLALLPPCQCTSFWNGDHDPLLGLLQAFVLLALLDQSRSWLGSSRDVRCKQQSVGGLQYPISM